MGRDGTGRAVGGDGAGADGGRVGAIRSGRAQRLGGVASGAVVGEVAGDLGGGGGTIGTSGAGH